MCIEVSINDHQPTSVCVVHLVSLVRQVERNRSIYVKSTTSVWTTNSLSDPPPDVCANH